MKLDPELEKNQHPFTLSIESCMEGTYLHAYHLGTNEKVAREFAKEVYSRVNNYRGCYTVALLRDGKIFDVWDGRDWANLISDRMFKENEDAL